MAHESSGGAERLPQARRKLCVDRLGRIVSTIVAAAVISLGIGEASAQNSTDAGNGGAATAGSSGSVVFGDVSTGENQGNIIYAGDIVNSDAEFNGGEVSNPTILYVTVPIGPPAADASGGNEAAAGGPDQPDPVTLNVRGDDTRSDVDVRTNDDNTNTNTNNNENTATGGNVSTEPTPSPTP